MDTTVDFVMALTTPEYDIERILLDMIADSWIIDAVVELDVDTYAIYATK